MFFSKKTKEILLNAGWKPGRRINIEKFKKHLESIGFSVHKYAYEFISEFNDLEIVHSSFKLRDISTITHFNSSEAADNIPFRNIKFYENKIHEKLIPVGEAYDSHLTLMVSDSGKLYGVYDDYFTLLGNTAYEGIEAICEGKTTPEILKKANRGRS